MNFTHISRTTALVFVATSLYGRAALANPTWAVVELPAAVLGTAPVYFYGCLDSTCSSQSQLGKNGYVTKVPTWQGLTPATWVFLETDGDEKHYALWQNTSGWKTCILHLQASGVIGVDNTCTGALKVAENSSADVSKINIGAGLFPDQTVAGPVNPKPYNPSPERTFTFSNDSTANGVCLQTDSTYAHDLCSGVHVYDLFVAPYIRSIPQNGDDSQAAQVIGIKYGRPEPSPWTATGRDSSGQVYGTKIEWTAFPTAPTRDPEPPMGNTDHSIGPTTLDASLVDGFNVGVELSPDEDTVCAVSETEGGPLVFKLFKHTSAMADFPTDVNTPVGNICPAGYEVKGKGQTQIGCYSQCSWAHATGQTQDTIDKNCCKNSYDTYPTCNNVIDHAYIDNVVDNSEGVYTWAYNDYRGTFTCDGSASFSLRVTDVFPPKTPETLKTPKRPSRR